MNYAMQVPDEMKAQYALGHSMAQDIAAGAPAQRPDTVGGFVAAVAIAIAAMVMVAGSNDSAVNYQPAVPTIEDNYNISYAAKPVPVNDWRVELEKCSGEPVVYAAGVDYFGLFKECTNQNYLEGARR